MAIRHGKAGQRLKDQAHKLYLRHLLAGFGVIALLTFFAGLLIGLYSWTAGLALLALPALVLLFLMRRLTKQADKWAKERIRLLRAGQTEALVAWMLESLPDGYHVFNNVTFPGGDLDHIVVGPAGLFVISTKNYRGSFSRNANGVLHHNNTPTDDPRQAHKQAMWLKDQLTKSLGGETPWIQSVLCAPFVDVRFDGRSNNVWIANDNTLLDFIDPDDTKAKLTGKLVERVVRVLEKLHG